MIIFMQSGFQLEPSLRCLAYPSSQQFATFSVLVFLFRTTSPWNLQFDIAYTLSLTLESLYPSPQRNTTEEDHPTVGIP